MGHGNVPLQYSWSLLLIDHFRRQGTIIAAIVLRRPGSHCTSPWWPGLRLFICTGHTIKFTLIPSSSFTDGPERIINLTKPMELVSGNNQDSITRLLVSRGYYFSAAPGYIRFTDKFYVWELRIQKNPSINTSQFNASECYQNSLLKKYQISWTSYYRIGISKVTKRRRKKEESNTENGDNIPQKL